MRKKPLVSILLPVYNESVFLQKAIDSIINQSYPNIEIIIINDGSTNLEVEEICLKYIDKIVYLRKDNGGVASALNYAINVAKGEYIARMDGDDISYPDRIYKQVEFLENNRDIDICGTNYEYIDENDAVIYYCNLPLNDSEIKVQNIFCCSLCHPSIMFRRKVFDNGLRYNESAKAEDYELWLRLEREVKFANLKEYLIGHRHNLFGVTKIYAEEMAISTVMLVKKHLNEIMDNAYENISEYNFGNISFAAKHAKGILQFLKDQVYIYSSIIKWNEDSHFYCSSYLTKIINKRWTECIKISGLRNFLINENRKEFLEIQYFARDKDNFENFYKSVAGIINAQLEMLKDRKRYLIYSIGKRGQAIYSELSSLREQKKMQWDLVGFGDKKEDVEELFSYPVYSINKIRNVEFDYIIIATNKYFEEIRGELIDRGVDRNKILDTTWLQWIEMDIE